MPLMFDQFGVRRVDLDVLMWPGFDHGFKQGQLSELYGALNSDDLFESCELNATMGAEFESEHWHYDISTTRIRIRSEAFETPQALDKRVLHLLGETKRFFTPRSLPFLTAERIVIRGIVPDDKGKDVAEILRSKMLASRLRKKKDGERLIDLLPGRLSGTGLELVGDTDKYHWHADIGPVHSPESSLTLRADLYFPPPEDPPDESLISERLQQAYDFMTTHVVEFARRALS
ncbi:MAG: hypothetical protein ACR2GL_02660 [Thermoleophilaceae bacterium]